MKRQIVLEDIIALIDEVIYELKLAPWNYDWEGNILDSRDAAFVIDDRELTENLTKQDILKQQESLERRINYFQNMHLNPWSFTNYEALKKMSRYELMNLKWKEIRKQLLCGEEWRVLAILKKRSSYGSEVYIPEMVPDDYLLDLISFRYKECALYLKAILE